MSFEFDHVVHRYTLDGVTIPGISFVLENTGFVDKTWFRPEHAERGHAVHAACQFLIEGNLDWSTVHPDILHRVREFERFLADFKPRLILAEKPLYSSAHRFAGTPDLVLEIEGERCVVDIKSGKSGLAAKLQTAAQMILVRYDKTIGPEAGIIKRFVLELPDEEKYKLIPHINHNDGTMFLNALSMIHRRINEGELAI